MVEDEGRKVNAQLEGLAQTGDRKLWGQVQSLYQLVCDVRWDPLFDREDAHGVRSTREDLLVRLRDWVWADSRGGSSELVVAGGVGTTCGMVPGQPPFVAAFGDKNQPYDKGEDRYRAKNARMDSLDELYLVAGVNDAFMAAFGDAVTVYLPRDTPRNVNELDAQRLVQLAKVMADPPTQPVFLDPTFPDRLQKSVMERTLGGILSITPADLATLVQVAGVRVNASVLGSTAGNSPFTDRSTTFRIRAIGKAGAVQSSIDAVVRMEKATTSDPIPVPGRLIHWREE
jgi:general secretion pathway protein K